MNNLFWKVAYIASYVLPLSISMLVYMYVSGGAWEGIQAAIWQVGDFLYFLFVQFFGGMLLIGLLLGLTFLSWHKLINACAEWINKNNR